MVKKAIKVAMSPSHPGEFIREEIIEPLNLSIAKAAEILDVRRSTLSDLINGKASLSPEMALRLEKAFDTKMEMLLKMQAWFDADQMRSRADDIPVQRYEPQ